MQQHRMMFLLHLLKKSLKLLLPLLLIVDNVGNVAAVGKFDDHFFQPSITKPLPSSNSNYNNNKKNEDYEYILPQRKVTSCPSFASFKFACQSNHLISIDSLVFAPVLSDAASSSSSATSSLTPNRAGECESDWRAECHDDSGAFEYAARECSSREQCSLLTYQLRSRTKCAQHQVVSIFYKCVPSWEITNVPIKCDICKNVTVNSIRDDNFGFIHSAWYPKLYPRVTCHSLIQSRPEHFIILYSVSGSIGLDRILIESLDHGAMAIREILTGNLTTRLVMTSSHDVNITVLTEDTYYFEQRRFLLYFYIVPKCYVILCSNVTGYPQVGYYPTTTPPGYYYSYQTNPTLPPFIPVTETISYKTTAIESYYPPASTPPIKLPPLPHVPSSLPQPPPPSYQPPSTYPPPQPAHAQNTYAPPLLAEYHNTHKHHSKLSDAWLAAILALIYALLMVFAVLVAIYCRRRRRRMVQENQIHIFSPSCVSSSHMLNNPSATITRSTHSQVSMRDQSIPSGYLTTSASCSGGVAQLCSAGLTPEHTNMIYSQVGAGGSHHLKQQQQQQQRDHLDMIECSYAATSMPAFQRQLNVNASTEFDNYSQVLSDDYDEEEVMNYGDIDVTNRHLHHHHHPHSCGAASRCQHSADIASLPYSLKTSTQHGAILASSNAAAGHVYANTSQQSSDNSLKNMYRAVEYKKGPQMEMVRVHNNECFDSNGELFDEIHTTTTTTTTTRYEEYLQKYGPDSCPPDGCPPPKVTTTESITYRRDLNGDIIEETTTTTTAGIPPSAAECDDLNNRSSSFVVKLYPSDEQEKEVQEMTMYVESPNTTHYRHF